jgi:hypothetical protein
MNDWNLGPLGLLQAYRQNQFSLDADMSRPEQLLPPGLGQFNYGYRPPQQLMGMQQNYQAPNQFQDYGGNVGNDDGQMGPADGGFDGADGADGPSGGK